MIGINSHTQSTESIPNMVKVLRRHKSVPLLSATLRFIKTRIIL